MKKVIFQFTVLCAACALMSASAQSGSQTGSSQSDISPPGSSSKTDELSATGRTGNQQSVRATQLMSAEVKDSSGDRIGRIQDVILNPSSGKIDFAVISLTGGMGSSASPSGSTSGSATSSGTHDQNTGTSSGVNSGGNIGSQERSGTGSDTGSTYSSASGKLIPVPWSLLQPSSSSSSSSTSSGSTMGSSQPSFTLAVSRNKLEQAPSFSSSSWSEIGQSTWRQRVFSHFGVSDTSTGGASSPSGSSQGSGSSDSSTPRSQH
jgi:sporulation protein YlmC with PRC-barrel domain